MRIVEWIAAVILVVKVCSSSVFFLASSTALALASAVSDAMTDGGFTGPRLGKVAIPSYQSEWGFLIGTKDSPPMDLATGPLPAGCHILDQDALASFFRIPAYYTRSL